MMRNAGWLLAVLSLTVIASLLLALASGSVELKAQELWAIIARQGESLHQTVVWEIRLPRALSAFATGGLLALGGALMQVLLRNPLADPYILGVSGGASAAALVVMMLGLAGFWLPIAAFAGALLSLLLVFGLAHGRGGWTPTRLLLTGVVVAAGWGALISLLLAISPQGALRGMLFWLMGDLGYAHSPWLGLGVLALGLAASLPLARDLNVLARGEMLAGSLGIAVGRLRYQVFFLASLLTAAAVTLAGSVGFVGLVVPHMLRLVGAHDHRVLLPASVLLGGTLLIVADTGARTVIAPAQLPVGVITALLGVPLFLFLLNRGSERLLATIR
ncbi:MAG: iron ABC transporter permease [Proteobacteria bacterium]|nr:MAG: iron ABC transporter permease [Pseudomonadota bacterium]